MLDTWRASWTGLASIRLRFSAQSLDHRTRYSTKHEMEIPIGSGGSCNDVVALCFPDAIITDFG